VAGPEAAGHELQGVVELIGEGGAAAGGEDLEEGVPADRGEEREEHTHQRADEDESQREGDDRGDDDEEDIVLETHADAGSFELAGSGGPAAAQK
jgi:hypothetical protein